MSLLRAELMAFTGMSGSQADATGLDDAEAVVALCRRERWIDRRLMTTLISTLVRLLASRGPETRSFLDVLSRAVGDDPLGEPRRAVDGHRALVARQMTSGGRWGVLP